MRDTYEVLFRKIGEQWTVRPGWRLATPEEAASVNSFLSQGIPDKTFTVGNAYDTDDGAQIEVYTD